MRHHLLSSQCFLFLFLSLAFFAMLTETAFALDIQSLWQMMSHHTQPEDFYRYGQGYESDGFPEQKFIDDAKFDQFKAGLGYVFRNFEIIIVFVAIAYTWLYVDTITIVLSIIVTVVGVYITVTYIDPNLVSDINIIRAGLFFLAGLIILLPAKRNNRILPIAALPIGVFSTLFLIKMAPVTFVDQDFINGAFIGILLIIFVAMAIWYALGEGWFLVVLQRTFGSFLIIAGVVVFGLAVG